MGEAISRTLGEGIAARRDRAGCRFLAEVSPAAVEGRSGDEHGRGARRRGGGRCWWHRAPALLRVRSVGYRAKLDTNRSLCDRRQVLGMLAALVRCGAAVVVHRVRVGEPRAGSSADAGRSRPARARRGRSTRAGSGRDGCGDPVPALRVQRVRRDRGGGAVRSGPSAALLAERDRVCARSMGLRAGDGEASTGRDQHGKGARLQLARAMVVVATLELEGRVDLRPERSEHGRPAARARGAAGAMARVARAAAERAGASRRVLRGTVRPRTMSELQ